MEDFEFKPVDLEPFKRALRLSMSRYIKNTVTGEKTRGQVNIDRKETLHGAAHALHNIQAAVARNRVMKHANAIMKNLKQDIMENIEKETAQIIINKFNNEELLN